MTKIFLLIILLMGVAACSDKNGMPSGILEPGKMQAVFWDIMRAETYTAQYTKKDSSRNMAVENAKLQQQIFATHHVTREDFYDSYRFYIAHTELMRTLLDSITGKAEREKYATLYAKPVLPQFSLAPLPPEPPIIPVPGVKLVVSPAADTARKAAGKIIP